MNLQNLLAEEVVSADNTRKAKNTRLGKLMENRPIDMGSTGMDVHTDPPGQGLWSLGRAGHSDREKQLYPSSGCGHHMGATISVPPGKAFLTLI